MAVTGIDLALVSKARRLSGGGLGRQIRQSTGVSLREAAAALEVSPATLSRWERGLRVPRGAAAARWPLLLDELARS